MRRFIRKCFKIFFTICLIFLVGGLIALAASVTPRLGDYVLHIEVNERHGDRVEVAVPLSMVNTAFKVMPKEIKEVCKELELTPSLLIDEMKEIGDEDFVRIEGHDNIRIYLDRDEMLSRGFIRVHVQEGGRHGHHINVWIPRGLVAFAGQIVSTFGIVDKYVELPPEIKEFTRLVKESN